MKDFTKDTNYKKPNWSDVMKLLPIDNFYFSPHEKKFMKELYEFIETRTIRQIEFIIDIVKPLYLEQCHKSRPHRYEIICVDERKDNNIFDEREIVSRF